MHAIRPLSRAIGLATLVLATGAHAQQPGSNVLDEIIVTAQKRDESLQTVPVAVTVTTGKMLESRGITSLVDLATHVPGFYTDDVQTNTKTAIRGFASTGSDIIESPVVTLMDGAFITNNRLISSAMYDLDRIEILHGPQGTLFGKNAIAGVLHVITAEPTEEFEGYVNLEGGSYDLYRVDAAVSGKIADGLYGRIAAIKSERDGWMDNTYSPDGGGLEDEAIRTRLRWEPSEQLRIDLKYEHVEHENIGSTQQLLEILDPSILATRRFQQMSARDLETNADRKQSVGPGPLVQGSILDRTTEGQGQDADLALARLSYRFDNDYELIASVNWTDYTNDRKVDANYAPIGTLPVYNYQDYETTAGELQIRSPADDRFSFIAGVYIEKSETERGGPAALDFDAGGGISDGVIVPTLSTPWYLLAPGDLAAAQPGIQAIQDAVIAGAHLTVDLGPGVQELERDIWSVYFEGRYEISEKWLLTAGLRYTEDKLDGSKDFINLNSSGDPLSSTAWIGSFMNMISTDPDVQAAAAVYPGGVPAGSLAPGFPILPLPDDFYAAVSQTLGLAYSFIQLPDGRREGDQTEDGLTPSVKLQYFPTDDTMLFAAFSTGFKGGGFNFDAVTPGTATEFEPEEAIGYELGVKMTLLGGAARFNASLFRTEFDDLQVTSINEQNTFTFQNAASAVSQGFELDTQWRFAENWTVSLAYMYLNAEYDDFEGAPCSIFDPNISRTCTQDLSGGDLQNAPEHSGALHLSYARSLNSAWDLVVDLAATYRDEISVSGANDFWADETTQLHGRIAFENTTDNWVVALRGSNLTDEDDVSYRLPQALFSNKIVTGAIVPPRMLTLQVKKTF